MNIMMLVLPALLAMFAGTTVESGSVRLEAGKYTVFLVADGSDEQAKERILRIYNNTKWAVSVPIANRDCHPPVDTRGDIHPLYEANRHINRDGVMSYREPNGCGDLVMEFRLPPGQSASFRVPEEYLKRGRPIHLRFEYEWELDGKGQKEGRGEPLHYLVYFDIHQ